MKTSHLGPLTKAWGVINLQIHYIRQRKEGLQGVKLTCCVWPGGTILGSKFISNSVCVEQGHRGMFLQESSSL